MKTIANRRQGFYHIGGDVRYVGIDAQEMAKIYKSEIVYNAEGVFSVVHTDVMMPVTCNSSLGWMRRCPRVSRLLSGRPPGDKRSSGERRRTMGLAYETISVSGPNAALPALQYHPLKRDSYIISKDAPYVNDSGGQYRDGT
jgi:hypothetical protein